MTVHLACTRQHVDAPIATTGGRLRLNVSSNYAIIGTTDDYPAIEAAGFSFAVCSFAARARNDERTRISKVDRHLEIVA